MDSDTPPATSGNTEPQGMNLTGGEAMALARRIIARQLFFMADDPTWLAWEDVPELGEHAFARLVLAADSLIRDAEGTADACDEHTGIDSRHLLARAEGCDHPSANGVDDTPLSDPGKRWECAVCGAEFMREEG